MVYIWILVDDVVCFSDVIQNYDTVSESIDY